MREQCAGVEHRDRVYLLRELGEFFLQRTIGCKYAGNARRGH